MELAKPCVCRRALSRTSRLSLRQKWIASVLVEGNLEGLIIHGKRRFLIFDPLTQRQVTCYFTDRVDWESVLHAFGKRVAASGFVRSRRSGEKVSITVSRLHVFPPEEELPAIDSVLGTLKAAK